MCLKIYYKEMFEMRDEILCCVISFIIIMFILFCLIKREKVLEKNYVPFIQRSFWGENPSSLLDISNNVMAFIGIFVLLPFLFAVSVKDMPFLENFSDCSVRKDLFPIIIALYIGLFTCLSLVLKLPEQSKGLFGVRDYIDILDIYNKLSIMLWIIITAIIMYLCEPFVVIIFIKLMPQVENWRQIIEFDLEISFFFLDIVFLLLFAKVLKTILQFLFTNKIDNNLLKNLYRDLKYKDAKKIEDKQIPIDHEFYIQMLMKNYDKSRKKINRERIEKIEYRSLMNMKNLKITGGIMENVLFLFLLIFFMSLYITGLGVEIELIISSNIMKLLYFGKCYVICFGTIAIFVFLFPLKSEIVRKIITFFEYGYSGYVYYLRNSKRIIINNQFFGKYLKYIRNVKSVVAYFRIIICNGLQKEKAFEVLNNVCLDDRVICLIVDMLNFCENHESFWEGKECQFEESDYEFAKAIMMDLYTKGEQAEQAKENVEKQVKEYRKIFNMQKNFETMKVCGHSVIL